MLQPIFLSLFSIWSNLTTRARILGIYCCVTKDRSCAGLRPIYYFTVSIGQASRHRLIGSLRIPQGCNHYCPGLRVSFDTLDPVPNVWIHFLAAIEVIFGLFQQGQQESLFFLVFDWPLKDVPGDGRPVQDHLHFGCLTFNWVHLWKCLPRGM